MSAVQIELLTSDETDVHVELKVLISICTYLKIYVSRTAFTQRANLEILINERAYKILFEQRSKIIDNLVCKLYIKYNGANVSKYHN